MYVNELKGNNSVDEPTGHCGQKLKHTGNSNVKPEKVCFQKKTVNNFYVNLDLLRKMDKRNPLFLSAKF